MIPTEEPIGPPDPLPYPSDDPTGIFVNLCVGSVKGVFYSSNLISFFSFVFIRSQTIDHWFCGISLDDANTICKQHCPTATECPMSQSKSWQDAVVGGGGDIEFHASLNSSVRPGFVVCFFGTKCESRTHSPTPPPTHRPT